jgi:plastocyanin
MRLLLVLLAMLAIPGSAVAGDLTVTVRDAAGRPVRDAVVTVHPSAGAPRGPIRFPWALRMSQQDVQFQPYVLIVPVGGTVAFPNLDRVRHHVYSFSRGQRFEIELYGRDETRSHTFRTVGVAAVGCNIHDQMVGYIKIVDTPWAAKSGADGMATLSNVPAGGATMRVWHPRLNARGNETATQITVAAGGGRQTFSGDFSARAAVR